MNHYRVACYALLASAFVLGGVLITQLGQYAESNAEAEMVISKNNFTLMTANTLANEEALFVLDNSSSSLMVYTLDLGRKRLKLSGGAKLSDLFATQAGESVRGSGGGR